MHAIYVFAAGFFVLGRVIDRTAKPENRFLADICFFDAIVFTLLPLFWVWK